MEESREKNAQSAQRASRIGFMQSLLGLSTPGSRTHAREQVDQKLEASGRKSEDVQRVKDFFDHLNEIAKEGSLLAPSSTSFPDEWSDSDGSDCAAGIRFIRQA